MKNNAYKYGFIVRYPKDKTSIIVINKSDLEDKLKLDIKARNIVKTNTISLNGTKELKDKIKEMFMGFVKYATVCFVIPGIVVGFFPGTFIALLVPIACKLLWNCYSLVKIYKQIKELCKNWKTLGKVQKIISVLTFK